MQYGFGFVFSLVLIIGSSYLLLRDTAYSCFDNVQNGQETGVDCGGNCVRICSVDVLQPEVIWATSFEITDGQYNALAYVENPNQRAATTELNYTFELYDGSFLITKRSGTTVFPPNSVYPIFEGRLNTGDRKVTETRLIIEPVDIWQPATAGREQFRSSGINLTNADERPRLEVSIENTELTEASDVEVVATLFNDAGEPLTASETYIEKIAARSSQDITFTWPNSIARTVRSCIIPTDVMLAIDVSGSMNNDGGTPPQPITDTLAAAQEFVRGLSEDDQAAVVSFASTADVVATLSSSHTQTASAVNLLQIAPEEETGFTNTAAALDAAATELNSTRHNVDARKVLVLLTDGLPTGERDQEEIIAEVEAKAAELMSQGIRVYAIGLGQNVDLDFINNLVDDRANAFYAPTRSELSGIYSEITTSLCESGTAKIDVIAKTKANFTPLR